MSRTGRHVVACGLTAILGFACGGPDTAGTGTATGSDSTETPATSTTGEDSTTSTSSFPGTVTTDGTPDPVEPEMYCPGNPSGECDEVVGAPLEAGAAVVSIVPECFETWIDKNDDAKYVFPQDEFLDCGCDRLCPGDEDYAGPDEGEGDGEFQAIWMAGFGNGRAAVGKRRGTAGFLGFDDGLWARAAVLRQGNTTVAIVALDLVGWFHDDVTRVRERLAEDGHEVDYLLVHSTHNHEGPDTMGLWGPKLFVTGYDERYVDQVREAVVSSVAQAIAGLAEVEAMVAGSVDVSTYDPDRGLAGVIRDSRDPVVIDETLSAVRLVGADDTTIATLVNFANHPETLADDNLFLTSDYVHGLRRTVELGSMWLDAEGRAGVGGVCVFLNGAVGGMMTTLGVTAVAPNGEEFEPATFRKADVIGQLLGEMALDAIEGGQTFEELELSATAQSFLAEVENSTLLEAAKAGVIKRTAHNDPDTGEECCLLTEMALVSVGPLAMLSVPGELLPELAIGGYDGSHVNSPVYEFIDPQNTLPPDVANAPPGPYLKERMPGEHRWIIGLGNDEIGYIIPEYDFVLADEMPYLNQAEGDHYEETNSLGPKTAGLVDDIADLLIAWEGRPAE